MKALGIDIDEETIERLVYGDLTFWEIRNELFNGSNDNDSKTSEEISTSIESALGIERETLDDLFNDEDEKNDEIEYVTVKITTNGNGTLEIIGADGKEYVVKSGEVIKLPKENAEILIKAGVAKVVDV